MRMVLSGLLTWFMIAEDQAERTAIESSGTEGVGVIGRIGPVGADWIASQWKIISTRKLAPGKAPEVIKPITPVPVTVPAALHESE